MTATARDPARRDVDRAALLGAALAAVVALTFGGEGDWDWLAAAAGVALLAVLAAFFRLPSATRRMRGDHVEIVAVSAVAALAATLVVAAPLQAALAHWAPIGRSCTASAEVAAGEVLVDERIRAGAQVAAARLAAEGSPTTAADALDQAAGDRRRTVLGNCLGAATTRWLPLPAVVLAVLIFAGMQLALRRSRRHAPG